MVAPLMIGGHVVGPGHPPLVIAESGVNHDGDVATALALTDAATDAGAHAAKSQTFRADALDALDAPKAPGRQRGRLRAANVIEAAKDEEAILAAITRATSPDLRAGLRGLESPYGDGRAAARVVERLGQVDLSGPALLARSFHDAGPS